MTRVLDDPRRFVPAGALVWVLLVVLALAFHPALRPQATTRPATAPVAVVDGEVVSLAAAGGKAVLSGFVPDEASHDALLARAETVFGGKVSDQLTIDPESSVQPWAAGIAAVVRLVGPPLTRGAVSASGARVVLRGVAPTAAVKAKTLRAARAVLGDGVTVADRITVRIGSEG